jgi:hypothetical protein
MVLRRVCLVLPAIFALVVTAAQCPARAQANPASFRLFLYDIVVEADGGVVETLRWDIGVADGVAARREARQAFSFADDLVTASLVEAFTLKADGRRLDVSAEAVSTRTQRSAPSEPHEWFEKQMVLTFPDVARGDRVSMTFRRTLRKPLFPGQFATRIILPNYVPTGDAAVSISVPDGMTLRTEAYGPTEDVERHGDRTVHRWHWRAAAKTADRTVDAHLDRVPRIVASTFEDWSTFSRTYGTLAVHHTAVTPRIETLADEITAGAADRREEAARLYDWVVRRIRWDAIGFGSGRWLPRPAETVLATGFGDCKEQVTLLVALLKARGIAAEPVLVDTRPTYLLPGPPVVTAFNHVIVHLPEWNLFADTTSGGAFGVLPWDLDGKPALRITETGEPPTRLPAVGADEATTRLVTRAVLDADGIVRGESVTEATGPFATDLRFHRHRILAQGMERAAANHLRWQGSSGSGTFTPTTEDTLGPDHAIAGRFVLAARPRMLEGKSFQLPTGLRLLPRPGDKLLRPTTILAPPSTAPTPCHAGTQTEELSLSLPSGFRPTRLPRPRTVTDEAFAFESRWSFEDGAVTVRRRFVSRVAAPLCEGPVRARVAKLLDEVRSDLNARVAIERAD